MVMPQPPAPPFDEFIASFSERRAMVVLAHPDDNEFACGGTVALLARAGWEVDIVVATSGNKGTKDPAVTPQYLAGVREEEQRRAARVLGAREPVFLGFPDGGLVNDAELRGLVVRELRRRRPTLALTWDGFRAGFNHSDHRRIGRATYDAVYPAADDHLYYPADKEEGLAPHRPDALLLVGAGEPDLHVDIGAVLETKVAAVFEHTSQVGDRSREEMLTFWRARAAETLTDAERARGLDPAVRESFRLVDFRGFGRRAAQENPPAPAPEPAPEPAPGPTAQRPQA